VGEVKTVPTGASVATFLSRIDDEQQRADSERLVRLLERSTGLEPAMWGSSIVGFGSYHYRYASGREGDTPLIGFSPRKGALAIYFTESFDAFEDCLATLGPHSAGKGCLRIKRLSDVDESVLSHMIERSVERQRQREPAPTS
jgi:hypothetical protein